MKYALLISHQEQEGERTPDALLPFLEFSKQGAIYGVELGGGR